jgi:predicted ATPase/DNA-binding SARP family transcriptional activator
MSMRSCRGTDTTDVVLVRLGTSPSGCHDDRVQIAVLGPLGVRVVAGAGVGDSPARVVEVAGARLRALLIRLAIAAPRPAAVPALVDALWGDQPPAEPANALQSLVSRLRRALHNPALVAQVPGGYRLLITEDDLDLRRFTRLAREGHDCLRAGHHRDAARVLRSALALWRGDAFDAAIRRDESLLARLHEQRLDALADRIDADLYLGGADNLVAELGPLIAEYPLREQLTLLLMRALHRAGRIPEALTAYERARRTLADELGIDPSPPLAAAHLALLRGEALDQPVHVLDLASELARAPEPDPDPSRHKLWAQLTSFVGREEDVRRIGKMLGDGRLISLVGPGGAGKTRLAIESVSRLVDVEIHGGGVWLAELAPITDPADVAQVVLAAVGLRDSTIIDRPGEPRGRDATGRLVDFFGDRKCVLVLDNCEHLIDAAAALTDELLAQCPQLRVLTTSREPLGIYGEVLVVIAPLGQPAADDDPESAMSFAATQLFADRAADARPSFVVDDVTVGSVVEIVRRLDGLPLAIELAAARMRTMPVEQIAARLTDRFRLLTGGSRTALPRHRTLLAVIEWSWDLMTEDERRLARRLAVFVGGITVASAADVCASSDLPEDVVEDLLASLVDKSLLQLVPDQNRYRMLETLREFGLDQMAGVGEVSAIRSAHARHFAALAVHADPQLRTRDQLIWLDVLNVERDNIVAALRFLADDGQANAALDVAMAMNWYWVLMGRHSEAATWTGFALAASGERYELRSLLGQAMVTINSAASLWMGAPDDIKGRMQAMADINTRLDEIESPELMHPLVRVLRPVMAMLTDRLDLAAEFIEEAMTSNDPWTVAAVRTFRAAMAENEGDTESVRADAQTSLAEFRELAERWGMANCLQLLAPLNTMVGNLPQAAADYREALEQFATLGALEDEALIRLRLAEVLLRQGDIEAARREIETAIHRREVRPRSESPISTEHESALGRAIQADIERQVGNLGRARELRDEAAQQLTRMPTPHPAQGHVAAMVMALSARLDLDEGSVSAATECLFEGYRVGLATKDMPIIAGVGVAVAMLAVALDRVSDAAEILGAAAALRGADDSTALDIIRLQQRLGDELGESDAASAYAAGRALDREQALARLDPALLVPVGR